MTGRYSSGAIFVHKSATLQTLTATINVPGTPYTARSRQHLGCGNSAAGRYVSAITMAGIHSQTAQSELGEPSQAMQ
jgi:hypothetical protein